ncbi:ABC transporter permease subunit [uncultured Shimia sp.]|uniref:ABC transporter permease n=1 Tax=uncultured Shimia sp. TaxID=573152 RepID=UPI002639B100|nr:ABC transporter permease subunit [uncultured Shimia sp.]
MIPFLLYAGIFIGAFYIVRFIHHRTAIQDYTSLKTVTFGDESAVRSNRTASIISIVTIFFMWGTFTGSVLLPSFLHMPGPYVGDGQFEITVQAPDGTTDDATVFWRVSDTEDGVAPDAPEGDGAALNDSVLIRKYRSGQLRWDKNDATSRKDGALIVAINGQPVKFDHNRRDANDNIIDTKPEVQVENGTVTFTDKGALSISPSKGMQMEPIWLPPPEAVWYRFIEIASDGYQGSTLLEHLGYSLFRVIVGFFFGALVGIPLGYAMGLSDWFRGWFDPIVEFMRPVPPLALIPLVIIWAGIGEVGKIILLFLAALWIMAIAARSGVSGVSISKVHAAYSLGANKPQIMRHVIIPNSLPEIFTGARVAMGVCWGTVVAAELVAASQGTGMMIMVASKFQLTDIVIMGIILIGIIGFGIDMLMRWAERVLVPWKGKG